jgi:hypothetical protein
MNSLFQVECCADCYGSYSNALVLEKVLQVRRN